MLKIIVEHSGKYKENIQKLCTLAGIGQYDVLDPMSHNINKHFKYVLMLGNIRAPHLKAGKVWQTSPPDASMTLEEKNKLLGVFKTVGAFVNANRTNDEAKKGDIPPLKNLMEFINELNGQVVELMLDDNRLLGIYPDGEPLKMKYDLEYHASTIVNLARINELFDVKKIMIKEV